MTATMAASATEIAAYVGADEILAASPDRFFIPRQGIDTVALLGAVREQVTVRPGPGGGLYEFRDGYWQADGDDAVLRATADALGPRYRQSHGSLMREQARIKSEQLGDEPDAGLINVRNGMLAWRDGALLEHSPEFTTYSQLPVEWHDGAECPVIDGWIRDTFPEDATEFVYEVIGYAMLNDQPLHNAILLHGKGRNGKGTFLRLITRLLGQQNVTSVAPQALGEDKFAAAQLHG